MYTERIRYPQLLTKIMTADEAVAVIQDGMTVGMSGFTRAGDCKAVPAALARKAARESLKLNLITGASLGHNSDATMAEAGVLAKRMPFQVDSTLRKKINQGEVLFIDQHLSLTAEQLRSAHLPAIDVAVVEAVAITETGAIIPSTSVGNTVSFVQQAQHIIVEINLSMPLALEGLHDIYVPSERPNRQPIALTQVGQRIGDTAIAIDPERIAAIIITDTPDSYSTVTAPDSETQAIAGHIVHFLEQEVAAGKLSASLLPLQVGIGNIANAVTYGLLESSFYGMTMYSEVLQDSAIALLDSGQLSFASASSLTLSAEKTQHFLSNVEQYRDRVVLRPQEISNHPELVRRLGIIAINTALEFDIYGNVNSTHVSGTHMMNGIGGSGDFARNAHLSFFVSKSVAKAGSISSVVPMVSHVDHTEHDVDVLVTEWGLADLRGLAPRERAIRVIEQCAHPDYRVQLLDYYQRACERGGHTPHILAEALSWHERHQKTGSMHIQQSELELV